MRSSKRGATIAGTLISATVTLMVLTTLTRVLWTINVLQDSGSIHAAIEQQTEFVFRDFRNIFNTSSVEGISISADKRTIAVQSIERVSSEGHRQWSSSVQVYHFDPTEKKIYQARVLLSALGIQVHDRIPHKLEPTELTLAQARAVDGKVLMEDVELFEISLDSDKPLVEIRLTLSTKNRKGKVEKMEALTDVVLSSSLEI